MEEQLTAPRPKCPLARMRVAAGRFLFKMVKVHWIPVTVGLPVDPDKNMLVVLRPPVGSTDFDEDDRWMEFATFDPGSGWSGGWDYYLGDDFIVTHWSERPEFPEDDE